MLVFRIRRVLVLLLAATSIENTIVNIYRTKDTAKIDEHADGSSAYKLPLRCLPLLG